MRGAITAGLAAKGGGGHQGLSELSIVADLFERKRWMLLHADAFVIFPGGFGTLDEALEAINWKSLGEHGKPIAFVDLKGYWRAQIKVYEEMARAGTIRRECLALYDVVGSAEALFATLDRAFAPGIG